MDRVNDFVPVAGLPRSGSTLLCNLLAENPVFHATPTSGLAGLLGSVRNSWAQQPAFRAQGIDKVRPQIQGMLKAMVYGFHEQAYLNGALCVFDKARLWPAHHEMLEEVLGRKVYVLFPTRDVREILASFERLYRADHLFKAGPSGATTVTRAESWLHPEHGTLGQSIEAYRDMQLRGLGDRLIIVPYRHLTQDPQGIMDALHEKLGFAPYAYDVDNVQQRTIENDEVHGILGLHDVRPVIEPQEPTWPQVLPMPYANALRDRYADMLAVA